MQHQRLKTMVSKGLELSGYSLENQQSEGGLAAVRCQLGRAAGQQCAFARVPQGPLSWKAPAFWEDVVPFLSHSVATGPVY